MFRVIVCGMASLFLAYLAERQFPQYLTKTAFVIGTTPIWWSYILVAAMFVLFVRKLKEV